MIVPTLEQSYDQARELAKAFGATYYAASFTLPRVKRHHVQAIYGFCRHAIETLSGLPRTSAEEREQVINEFGERLFGDLAAGTSDDAVLKAVVHTARSFDLDPDYFRRFLRAMTNSLTVTSYDTFEDLLDHMDGSAAVIGEMILPILEPHTEDALPYARDFAIACRLTDYWSDVNRDLGRGRVFFPQEDLRHFGADPWLRRVTPEWRALMAFEIRRTREYFATSAQITDELPVRSARFVSALADLQEQLLERIDRVGGDVFTTRPQVPTWKAVEVVTRRSLRRTPSGEQ